MLPKSLRPLLPYLKRYRWGYAAGTLCVFLTNGIWICFRSCSAEPPTICTQV